MDQARDQRDLQGTHRDPVHPNREQTEAKFEIQYARKIADRAYFCSHGTKKEWSSVVTNIENIKKLKNEAKKVLVKPR